MYGSDNNQQSGVPTGVANNDVPAATTPTATSNLFAEPATQSSFPPAGQPSTDPFGTVPAAVSQTTDISSDSKAPLPENEELIGIKQQALQELSPLVQHLDQSAEEKFKTTMMMIQASDDKSLVPVAFESAKKIEDDKVRAQALLDIINEINYFTQQ